MSQQVLDGEAVVDPGFLGRRSVRQQVLLVHVVLLVAAAASGSFFLVCGVVVGSLSRLVQLVLGHKRR